MEKTAFPPRLDAAVILFDMERLCPPKRSHGKYLLGWKIRVIVS